MVDPLCSQEKKIHLGRENKKKPHEGEMQPNGYDMGMGMASGDEEFLWLAGLILLYYQCQPALRSCNTGQT